MVTEILMDFAKVFLFSYLAAFLGMSGLVHSKELGGIEKKFYAKLLGVGILLAISYILFWPEVGWTNEPVQIGGWIGFGFGILVSLRHFESGFKLLLLISVVFLLAMLTTVFTVI